MDDPHEPENKPDQASPGVIGSRKSAFQLYKVRGGSSYLNFILHSGVDVILVNSFSDFKFPSLSQFSRIYKEGM